MNDYVTFEDLTMENTGATFGRVLDITGGSDNNRFETVTYYSDFYKYFYKHSNSLLKQL